MLYNSQSLAYCTLQKRQTRHVHRSIPTETHILVCMSAHTQSVGNQTPLRKVPLQKVNETSQASIMDI